MEYKLTLPLSEEDALRLRSGDRVLLTGIVYTARDEAHERLCAMEDWPFAPRDAAIYYTGPCPAPPERVIGPVGPTTSARMDAYTPTVLKRGVRCLIGKGQRSESVKAALREYKAVYLAATGGAGALLSLCVKSARVLAFPELGAEAVHELYVEQLPCTVINDCCGGDLYAEGQAAYRK